jgi:type I restriction enzyme, S subunit
MKWPIDMVPFESALEDHTPGQAKIQRSDYQAEGDIPILDQGQKPVAGFTSDPALAYQGPLPAILFGDHTLLFKYVDFPFAIGADGVRVLAAKPGFLCKFLYYYFHAKPIHSRGYSRHFKFLRDKLFPLITQSEQGRIVGLLELADGLRQKRSEADALADGIVPALFHKMFGDPVTNPKRWPRSPLGAATVIDAPMVDPREPEYVDLPHVGPDRIEAGTGRLLRALTAREEGLISGKYLFDERHVLYSKIRPYLRKVALPESRGLCSADMYPVTPLANLATREYLWALLLTPAFTNYTAEHSGRANIPKVNREQFASYQCPIPPVALQRVFSALVVQLCSLTGRRTEVRQGIDTLFATMLHRAFSGVLTAKWREAHMKELLAEMEHQARVVKSPAQEITFG